MPTLRKGIAMPARRSKAKSATRKKTAARKTTVARRRPAARRKPAAKKATTRRKTATKTSEQLGAPLPPPEPMMPVADPALIREPMPQPASPLPETEEAEERELSMDFSEREEEPGKDSEWARVASMKAVLPREDGWCWK